MIPKTITVSVDVLARELVGRFIRERTRELLVTVNVTSKGPKGYVWHGPQCAFTGVTLHLDGIPIEVHHGTWEADNRANQSYADQHAESRRALILRYRDEINDKVQAAMEES